MAAGNWFDLLCKICVWFFTKMNKLNNNEKKNNLMFPPVIIEGLQQFKFIV